MESVKAFYLMGEGFRESRLYEMRMLCREFFPGAEIRQEPCDQLCKISRIRVHGTPPPG